MISGCLHHSWQKLNVFSVEVPYVYLKRVELVTASGPCLVSQVTTFAIDDVKYCKTQLSFESTVKTLTLVLGTERWSGFEEGTVKDCSEKLKSIEM